MFRKSITTDDSEVPPCGRTPRRLGSASQFAIVLAESSLQVVRVSVVCSLVFFVEQQIAIMFLFHDVYNDIILPNVNVRELYMFWLFLR